MQSKRENSVALQPKVLMSLREECVLTAVCMYKKGVCVLRVAVRMACTCQEYVCGVVDACAGRMALESVCEVVRRVCGAVCVAM